MSHRHDILACSRCSLRSGCASPVPGNGPSSAKIMLIGEAPGENEDKLRSPFCGAAGKLLSELLSNHSGLHRQTETYVTNAVKCRPPKNRTPTDEELLLCRRHLAAEISAVRPEVVVTLGRTAERSLSRLKTSFPGIFAPVKRIEHCTHPAAALHNPKLWDKVKQDFQKLRDSGTGNFERDKKCGVEPPEIYPVMGMGEFVDWAGDKHVIAVDTETDPDGSLVWVSASDGESTVLVRGGDFDGGELKIDDALVVMHNAAFDMPVLERAGMNWGRVQVFDTMIAAASLQLWQYQGLKPLAREVFGLEMTNFDNLVEAVANAGVKEYLSRVLEVAESGSACPEPQYRIKWGADGKPTMGKGRGLKSRIKTFLPRLGTMGREPWKAWEKVMAELGDEIAEWVRAAVGDCPKQGISAVPDLEAVRYAGTDALVTMKMFEKMDGHLDEAPSCRAAYERDMRALPLVNRMEAHGIAVNAEELRRLDEEFAEEMGQIEREVNAVAGRRVNLGSPKQTTEFLFDDLNLCAPKRSSDAKIMRMLAVDNEVVAKIVTWRSRSKLRSSFIATLLAKSQSALDGRVRARLRLNGTETGRMTSTDPNLLALPSRKEDGSKVRSCIVAEKGNVLVACDFGQMDFRIAAHIAEDEEMMRVFRDGIDPHSNAAERLFGIKQSEMDPVQWKRKRSMVKPIGFGVMYGLGAESLLRGLKLEGVETDLAECGRLIEDWFKLHEGIRQLRDRCIDEAKRTGFVWTPWGRRRRIVGLDHPQFKVRSDAERQCLASVVQMGTADATKAAMGNIMPIVTCAKYRCMPLLQIHDSLIFEVEESAAWEFAGKLEDVMRKSLLLKISIDADAEVGYDLSNMKMRAGNNGA